MDFMQWLAKYRWWILLGAAIVVIGGAVFAASSSRVKERLGSPKDELPDSTSIGVEKVDDSGEDGTSQPGGGARTGAGGPSAGQSSNYSSNQVPWETGPSDELSGSSKLSPEQAPWGQGPSE